MCLACADKVLLQHFRAWAETDPGSHLSTGAKVSHNTSLWLFVLWRACRLLLPVSHAEEEGTSIYNTPETEASTMHRESIFYANEWSKLCILHPVSLMEIIPTTRYNFFLCFYWEEAALPNCHPLVLGCMQPFVQRMCTYTREVQLQKYYLVKFSILLPLIGPCFGKLSELNTE